MTLDPRVTPRANVTPTSAGWRLEIPAGAADAYRLAQLDNYRRRFPLDAPATLSLRCRVSGLLLPGTWGFGFWNDPFAVSFGLQGSARRLPALPNAAWFFHASTENHLSLRPAVEAAEHGIPGSGFMAQVFSSPRIPSLLLAPGLLALPFMFSKTFAKRARALAGKIVHEDGKGLGVDVTQWHEYRLRWEVDRVEFTLDGEKILETATSPQGPLGLVVWIDNQFASFPPDGKIKAGVQENPAPAWMEIEDVTCLIGG